MRAIFSCLAALMVLAPGLAFAQTVAGPARVIDGDTLAIDGVKDHVRLSYIDAPERDQTCQNAKGSLYPCGMVAAQALTKMIPSGTEVSCKSEGRDGYGRYLGLCQAGGTDINGSMVASGWAVEYDRYSDGRYGRVEEKAKSAGRGLWQGSFVLPSQWRDRKRESDFKVAEDRKNAEIACSIKGNLTRNGRIYHMPGQADYERVRIDESRGERMFCNENEAKAAGWRRAIR